MWDNFATILPKIFSPLFLIIMAAFLIVMIVTGNSPFMERDFLIAFDFMLALVLGLVLYVISARDIRQPANLFDYLNLALILTALVIDGVALSAIIFRLSAFGITPISWPRWGRIWPCWATGRTCPVIIGYFKKKFDSLSYNMADRFSQFISFGQQLSHHVSDYFKFNNLFPGLRRKTMLGPG